MLPKQHRRKAPIKKTDLLCMSNVHCLTIDLRIYFSIKLLILMKLSSRYLSQDLLCCNNNKNACFCCSCSYLGLFSEDSLFLSSAGVATLCQSSATFSKLMCNQRARVFVFAYCCNTSAICKREYCMRYHTNNKAKFTEYRSSVH